MPLDRIIVWGVHGPAACPGPWTNERISMMHRLNSSERALEPDALAFPLTARVCSVLGYFFLTDRMNVSVCRPTSRRSSEGSRPRSLSYPRTMSAPTSTLRTGSLASKLQTAAAAAAQGLQSSLSSPSSRGRLTTSSPLASPPAHLADTLGVTLQH